MIHPSPAYAADVLEMVLRPEDAREVSEGWRDMVSQDPDVLAYRDDEGGLVALFGVTEHADQKVLGVWLLCSELAEKERASVWRVAKRTVASLRRVYRGWLIFNYIPKDSVRNRAFIQRLGFVIVPSPGHGPDFFYLPHV